MTPEQFQEIRTLTPHRVQIEAELREATIRIQEMQWWHDNPAANKSAARHKRLQEQYVFIATLEHELEAERKRV